MLLCLLIFLASTAVMLLLPWSFFRSAVFPCASYHYEAILLRNRNRVSERISHSHGTSFPWPLFPRAHQPWSSNRTPSVTMDIFCFWFGSMLVSSPHRGPFRHDLRCDGTCFPKLLFLVEHTLLAAVAVYMSSQLHRATMVIRPCSFASMDICDLTLPRFSNHGSYRESRPCFSRPLVLDYGSSRASLHVRHHGLLAVGLHQQQRYHA